MPGEARWITSTSAGGLHAAARMLAGAAPVDPKLATQQVAAEVDGLASDLAAVGLEPAPFFEHAIPLAVRFDSPLELADVALRKILGPRLTDAPAQRLARRLQSLWAAIDQANPLALEELELRSGPLREQWEARGPGLLATVGRLTDQDLVVEGADVILVQPVLGGGGSAHPLYNAVAIEAVLANPIGELPEIARLGWQWAQLNLDLPEYYDQVGRAAMTHVGPLAVLPAVLAAADEVELVTFDRRLLETALGAWNAPAVDADKLLRWWETYQASSLAWTVALAALARMLDE
ncbi:MAG: hypothetical protein WD063_12060 [Pirellulales bacterium]